jgi:hypothetical protein
LSFQRQVSQRCRETAAGGASPVPPVADPPATALHGRAPLASRPRWSCTGGCETSRSRAAAAGPGCCCCCCWRPTRLVIAPALGRQPPARPPLLLPPPRRYLGAGFLSSVCHLRAFVALLRVTLALSAGPQALRVTLLGAGTASPTCCRRLLPPHTPRCPHHPQLRLGLPTSRDLYRLARRAPCRQQRRRRRRNWRPRQPPGAAAPSRDVPRPLEYQTSPPRPLEKHPTGTGVSCLRLARNRPQRSNDGPRSTLGSALQTSHALGRDARCRSGATLSTRRADGRTPRPARTAAARVSRMAPHK